jgi:hypothetical protein
LSKRTNLSHTQTTSDTIVRIDAPAEVEYFRHAGILQMAYAQAHFLRNVGHASVTATTRDWRVHAPRIIPLPHPSPRNVAWFKANSWFEDELLPGLRRRVRSLLGGGV